MKYGVYVVRNRLDGLLTTPVAFLFATDERAGIDIPPAIQSHHDEYEILKVGLIDYQTGAVEVVPPVVVPMNLGHVKSVPVIPPELLRHGTPEQIEQDFADTTKDLK